jgi:hypothetical protein
MTSRSRATLKQEVATYPVLKGAFPLEFRGTALDGVCVASDLSGAASLLSQLYTTVPGFETRGEGGDRRRPRLRTAPVIV